MLQVSGGVLFKKSNKVSRDFTFCGTSNDKLYYSEDWDLLCIFDENMSFGGQIQHNIFQEDLFFFFFLVCL